MHPFTDLEGDHRHTSSWYKLSLATFTIHVRVSTAVDDQWKALKLLVDSLKLVSVKL